MTRRTVLVGLALLLTVGLLWVTRGGCRERRYHGDPSERSSAQVPAQSTPRAGIKALALHQSGPTAAESLAAALGFEYLLVSGFTWKVTSRFEQGALVWYDALTDREFGDSLAAGPLPILTSPLDPACGLPPTGRWEHRGAKAMPHPNGALALIRITAVVPSLEAICPAPSDGVAGRTPVFGPAFEVPWLGARAREAEFGGVAIRILEPNRPGGPAESLLRHGGVRWVGGAIRVADLRKTAAWLARKDIRFERARTLGRDPLLWVGPDAAGGALIEFEL